MKCAVFSRIGRPLRLETRPDPQPSEDEVCIELRTAALNRRDYWITQGRYPGIKLPAVLGSDGAGVVVGGGTGADSIRIGEEVIINPGRRWGNDIRCQSSDFRIQGMPEDGTFATHIVVPRSYVAARPPGCSWHEAAALPLAGVTAWRACFTRGEIGSDDRVLITGIGGGVATVALQLVHAIGVPAAVTSSCPEKLQRARDLGAEAGFLYTDRDWVGACREQFGRPTVIIDGAGGAGYNALIDLLAPGGRLVSYDATAGTPRRLDLFKIVWKQLDVRGTTMGSPDDFDSLLSFVRRHNVRPVVDRIYRLDEINNAMARQAGNDHFGKIVIGCT